MQHSHFSHRTVSGFINTVQSHKHTNPVRQLEITQMELSIHRLSPSFEKLPRVLVIFLIFPLTILKSHTSQATQAGIQLVLYPHH